MPLVRNFFKYYKIRYILISHHQKYYIHQLKYVNNFLCHQNFYWYICRAISCVNALQPPQILKKCASLIKRNSEWEKQSFSCGKNNEIVGESTLMQLIFFCCGARGEMMSIFIAYCNVWTQKRNEY